MRVLPYRVAKLKERVKTGLPERVRNDPILGDPLSRGHHRSLWEEEVKQRHMSAINSV